MMATHNWHAYNEADIKKTIGTDLFDEWRPVIFEHYYCLSKAGKKLPTWNQAGCVYATKPYEQCSAEAVAKFRASLFAPGEVLSITGGLGVDDWALAASGHRVTSLDIDPCLNALFTFNAEKLGCEQIERITRSAEAYLEENRQSYNLIFADPDRRASGKRVGHQTSLYSPDVYDLMKRYPKAANTWAIKLSPMVDLDWLRNNTPEADLYVISLDGEIKEVMQVIHARVNRQTLLVSIRGEEIFTWDGMTAMGQTASDRLMFTEASAGAIKCGFNRRFESHFGLNAQNENNTFFTGMVSLHPALGRSFTLLETLEGSLSKMGSELKRLGISKAHITARNFVSDSEETRSYLKLEDGGDFYLFFSGRQQKRCFVCRRD